jgi:hypothetical protein
MITALTHSSAIVLVGLLLGRMALNLDFSSCHHMIRFTLDIFDKNTKEGQHLNAGDVNGPILCDIKSHT